jgi:hypothetical protein
MERKQVDARTRQSQRGQGGKGRMKQTTKKSGPDQVVEHLPGPCDRTVLEGPDAMFHVSGCTPTLTTRTTICRVTDRRDYSGGAR